MLETKKRGGTSINLIESFGLAFQYLRRNLFLSFTVILTMTLTFFLSSIFIGAGAVSNSVLSYLESKAQLTVFFRNDVPVDKIMAIKLDLEKSGRVYEVNYVSQDDALKIYLGQNKDKKELLESAVASIFPPSLEIRSKRISDLPKIDEELKLIEGVEEVVFFRDVVETFRQWASSARIIGLTLIIILSIISILITLIVIGMTIFSRGEEIEVMRLVGATENYIRLPFLIQGALYGIFGSLLSSLLFIGTLPFVVPYARLLIDPSMEGYIRFPLTDLVFLFGLIGGQMVFGIILGSFGSFAAMRRYLRV